MNISSADLLRVLGSGLQQKIESATKSSHAMQNFAGLLESARKGDVQTGLPVEIVNGADVTLSQETLDKIAAIVDRAHAAGATRIVVLDGEQALDVDVLSRRVLGKVNLHDGHIMTEIDGVARLSGDNADSMQILPLPGERSVSSASLLRELEKKIAG